MWFFFSDVLAYGGVWIDPSVLSDDIVQECSLAEGRDEDMLDKKVRNWLWPFYVIGETDKKSNVRGLADQISFYWADFIGQSMLTFPQVNLKHLTKGLFYFGILGLCDELMPSASTHSYPCLCSLSFLSQVLDCCQPSVNLWRLIIELVYTADYCKDRQFAMVPMSFCIVCLLI